MHILVDMDGVIAGFDRGFLDIWKVTHPDEPFYPIEERTVFHLHEQYGPEYSDKIRAITSAPGFFRNLPPIPGAVDILPELINRGHLVQICTSPMSKTPTCLQEKYDWVVEHLGDDLARTMIIAKDKTMIKGDVLVDDRPSFVGRYFPEWRHVVFHAAYNASLPKSIWRLRHWKEALDMFGYA